MRKNTLSRFFLGFILGGMAGLVAYALDVPYVFQHILNNIAGTGIAVFNGLIGVIIWPLSVFAFMDAFRIMWSMIRGHYGGSDSVRVYIATTLMAVVIALLLGDMIINRMYAFMDFTSWINARQDVVVLMSFVDTLPALPQIEWLCIASAVAGVIFAEWDIAQYGTKLRKQDFFEQLYERLIEQIYKLYAGLPILIFLVSFAITAYAGISIFVFVFIYGLLVFALIFLHALLVYSGIIGIMLRLSPVLFFKKCAPLIRVAGWTINSKETEPITMRTATVKLGVPEGIAKNVVQGGTTLNMDGTAIMQTIAVLITAKVYGIPFIASDFMPLAIMLVTIAVVTTAGTLTGMFTLGIAFYAFGIPFEMLAVIISISHVVSSVVTPVNILGDLVAAMSVADEYGKLDRNIYNS